MNDEKKLILAVCARVLDYPDETQSEELTFIFEAIAEVTAPEKTKIELRRAIDFLKQTPLVELQMQYVETFDYKEKTGLYLTAHEYGDNRRRGVALVDLKRMIEKQGFQLHDGELPDYIPLLLEWIAVTNDDMDTYKLKRRLAVILQRIFENLPEQNPYRPIFQLLLTRVFPPPTEKDVERAGKDYQEADSAPLPYPLLYS